MRNFIRKEIIKMITDSFREDNKYNISVILIEFIPPENNSLEKIIKKLKGIRNILANIWKVG